MPLSFDEFKVSRYYRPKVLGVEDESQDPMDMRRAHKRDQEEQYERYILQFGAKELKELAHTVEEKKVEEPHPLLRKALHNTETALRNGDDDVLRKEKWNAYMREYRKKKKCRHCGKLNP